MSLCPECGGRAADRSYVPHCSTCKGAGIVPTMTGPTAHPEAHCQRCGDRNPVWFTPLWNEVMRENGKDRWGIVCPRCFAELAEAKGIGTQGAWRWEPENYDQAGEKPKPFGGGTTPNRGGSSEFGR